MSSRSQRLCELANQWLREWRKDPEARVRSVLNLYEPSTYGLGPRGLPAFLGQNAEDVVFDSLRSNWALQEIERDAALVLMPPSEGRSQTIEDVLESLMLRVPVFYGQPMVRNYVAERVLQTLGYDPHDVPYHRDLRFALVAPCRSAAAKRKFFSVHAWGINLESCRTQDYETHVDESGRLKLEGFDREQTRIARLLTASVEYVASQVDRPCHFRLPAMGMGFFLSALSSEEDKFLARTTFVRRLEEAVANLDPDQVASVELCLAASLQDPGWNRVLKASDRSHLRVSGSNLFDLSKVSAAHVPVVLNSWDDRSFVGNGGTRDNSVDGWYVSGFGPGAAMANDSFLHNPFFCPKFLRPSKWVRVQPRATSAAPGSDDSARTERPSSLSGDARSVFSRESAILRAKEMILRQGFSDVETLEQTGLRRPLSRLSKEVAYSDPEVKKAFKMLAERNDPTLLGLYTNVEGQVLCLTLGSVSRRVLPYEG